MNSPQTELQTDWHIVQRPNEQCIILTDQALRDLEIQSDTDKSNIDKSDTGTDTETPETQPSLKVWGPFKTQNQAIAKRIGLIRAGKCRPL